MTKPDRISCVKWIGPLTVGSVYFDQVVAVGVYNQLTLVGHMKGTHWDGGKERYDLVK